MDKLDRPLGEPIERCAVIGLYAAILEILVRLAQSMMEFPEDVVCAMPVPDVMELVNGSPFSNIHRAAGSGKRLALKEPRRCEGALEILVRLLTVFSKTSASVQLTTSRAL